jgi:hypothetical protein
MLTPTGFETVVTNCELKVKGMTDIKCYYPFTSMAFLAANYHLCVPVIILLILSLMIPLSLDVVALLL